MPSTFTLSKASVTSSAMLMIPAVWITTTEARSAPSNRARRDSGSVTSPLTYSARSGKSGSSEGRISPRTRSPLSSRIRIMVLPR